MPVGVQSYGNFCREDLLLQLAAQIERARPGWFGAIPPPTLLDRTEHRPELVEALPQTL